MHGTATSKDLLRIQYDVHRTWKALDIRKSTKKLIRAALCLQSDSKAGKTKKKDGAKKQKADVGATAGGPGGAGRIRKHQQMTLSRLVEPPLLAHPSLRLL